MWVDEAIYLKLPPLFRRIISDPIYCPSDILSDVLLKVTLSPASIRLKWVDFHHISKVVFLFKAK